MDSTDSTGSAGSTDSSRTRTVLMGILTSLAATWFLRETYVVTMPLAAAMFIAAVIWPVYRAIARRASWAALPLSMALVICAAMVFFGAISTAVAFAIQRAPEYVDAGRELWRQVVDHAKHFGLPADQLTLGSNGQLPTWVSQYVTYGLGSLWSLCGFMVLVFFFAALMVAEARRWADKTQSAMENDRAWRIIDTTQAIAGKLRAYLLTQTMIAVTSGVLQCTFLLLMRVPLAPAWGLLFFILEFIPNLGAAIALVPPTLVMLATKGPVWGGVTLGGIILIETMVGYVITPMWQARNLAISPVVVLLSVVFWGWVWGVVGAVLAVPLTATILITCAHVESLRPIAMLLSTTSSHRELKKQTAAEAS